MWRIALYTLALGVFALACDSDPADPIDGAVESLEVTPATAWLVSGSSLQLDAVARDAHGTVTNVLVQWTSTNSSVERSTRDRSRQTPASAGATQSFATCARSM